MTIKNSKSLQKSAIDEDIEEMTKDADCNAKDEDVDKRALIDEIGGMLKDKVDEELWRTIVGKCELLAYNDSENGSEDEDDEPKDDDKPAEDEDPAEEPVLIDAPDEKDDTEVVVETENATVEVSMDAMIKQIGQRDALIEAVKPLIGDNVRFKQMTISQVAKYACDKLDLKVSNGQEVSVLRGYIAAAKKHENNVTYSLDNAINLAPAKDDAFERYIKGE